MDKLRIDKWLWAVRMFKTRSLATEHCSAGKVKMEGENVKASKMIKVGDVLETRINHIPKKLKVITLIDKRVGAEIAQQCYEDLSPIEPKNEYLKSVFIPSGKRDRGSGRPTKRERRDIDRWQNFDFDL